MMMRAEKRWTFAKPAGTIPMHAGNSGAPAVSQDDPYMMQHQRLYAQPLRIISTSPSFCFAQKHWPTLESLTIMAMAMSERPPGMLVLHSKVGSKRLAHWTD